MTIRIERTIYTDEGPLVTVLDVGIYSSHAKSIDDLCDEILACEFQGDFDGPSWEPVPSDYDYDIWAYPLTDEIATQSGGA